MANRSSGQNCPACARYGFDASQPSILYLLHHPEFRSGKIGITAKASTRISRFERAGWTLIFQIERETGEVILAAEWQLLEWIRGDLGLMAHLGPQEMPNTGGWTETFSYDGVSAAEVVQRMRTIVDALETGTEAQ